MKRTITPYLLYALCFTFFTLYSASGQNFLWGRSGGSVEPGNGPELETVRDMATDRNGNVYILTHVKKQGMNIAGQPVTGYGGIDIVLASFSPDGSLRWKKLIGNGEDEHSWWLGTDAKDGVYFSAETYQDDWPSNIDQDATTTKSYQRFILVKYDTSGNFQWYRQPEADTLSSTLTWNYNRSLVMDVDGAGNTYWVMYLYPGSYGNGALTVTTLSTYIIKYTASGSFSYIKPSSFDVDPLGASGMYMTIDDVNNRFYLSGNNSQGSLMMNGDPVSNAGYIGAFKMDGTFLWKKTGTCSFKSRAALDEKGNIYLTGGAKGQSSLGPASEFNGYTATNGPMGGPFITKMDKNGNHIWSRAGDAKAASSGAYCVGLRGKEVVIAGSHAGPLEWPGYSYPITNSTNYDVFITRFDTSNGYVFGMDKIASSFGYGEYPSRMIADGRANVYIGGELEADMIVNAAGKITSTGGTTDWFLVKYGDMWPVSVNTAMVDEVKIYPNPADDKLYVEGAEVGMQAAIFNLLGQQVHSSAVNSNKELIDISNLVPGNYMLQLTGNDGSKNTVKLTKQ